MNRVEFIDAVSAKTEVDKKVVAAVVAAYNEVVTETLAAGDSVSFVGFGTYKPVAKAARTARNPKTGETVKVAAKTIAKFSPSSALSAAVNTPKKKSKKK